MMKTVKIAAAAICMAICVAACGQNGEHMDIASEAADYIFGSKEIEKDISGEDKGIVTFSDGKIKISDKNLKFSENCMVEDDRIIINSNDYGVIILNYKMYGDILELEYFGKKITLNKK